MRVERFHLRNRLVLAPSHGVSKPQNHDAAGVELVLDTRANKRRIFSRGMETSLYFDEIGEWSEIKLEIIKEYAGAYSTILSAHRLSHVYIDAFAGAGRHLSRTTMGLVPGSPLNALMVEPPFDEFYLIDIAPEKVDHLKTLVRRLFGSHTNIHIYQGDCNGILTREVFPHVQYEQFRRGLCLLDPYALHLNWEVIETAGKMNSLDVFLNFPVMDINRNVFWRNPEGVAASHVERMNRFWGDESWRDIVYQSQPGLFGPLLEKEPNEVVAEAFRRRLRDAGGFRYVPEPRPMKNSKGAAVYYLFFASQNETAAKIARQIFTKARGTGSR